MGISRIILAAVAAAVLPVAVESSGGAASNLPVCIVGAGPSGLTAAKALEDKGRDVVVFEKRSDVGGKCQSYYKDGKYYPLGAVLFTGTAGYADTYELVNRTGVPYRAVTSTELWTFDPDTGSTVLSTTAPETALLIQADLVRYTAIWQSLLPIFSVPSYQNGVPPALALPAQEWLVGNGLLALGSILNRLWGDYGYGPITDVPALYWLRSAQPDIIASILSVSGLFTIDFHEVFTRQSETINGPILLKTKITSIDRTKANPSITYVQGQGRPKTQKCSDVILAFPPTLSALSDAKLKLSSEEQDLFSKVVTNSYFASAVEMTELSHNVSLRHELPGPLSPYAEEGQPVYAVRIHEDTDVVTAWSVDKRGQSDSVEVAKELLPEVLGRLNKDVRDPDAEGEALANEDVLAFSGDVDYFPHIQTEALLGGWYDDYNTLQGKSRTYYASGVSQFEFIEYAIRGAQDLVEEYF